MNCTFSLFPREETIHSELCLLQDHAIRSGIDIPDDIIRDISSVKVDGQYNVMEMLLLMKRLTQVTKPMTILNAPIATRAEEYDARKRLWWCGMALFMVMIIGSALGVVVGNMSSSVNSCNLITCRSVFSLSVLLYGASLGAMGAMSYQLFSVGRLIVDDKLSATDKYGSFSRLLLGGIFGWLFTLVFSRTALTAAFMFDVDDESYAGATQYLLLLLPFLAGYSSTLVTGLLNRLVEAVAIALRLESK